ncbi:NAD-P-binding protein [Artomyces pyxidatus]|uniref:NAD-P-binding protein n=1 Tax=Artomyces pyxidatus TaxID=48021 RepID=A0ACB8T6W5_9AGAM|nr:NAD-P-binding protein [Artomyces pyxidatus]
MSDVRTWLVTGANRGIGLEIVKQLIASPTNVVVATCRKPESASALQELATSSSGRIHIVCLDVSDSASISTSVDLAKGVLNAHGLDYLINNAAIMPVHDNSFNLSEETILRTFKVNVVGPALTTQAYLPYLEKGKRKIIVNISSALGSLSLCPQKQQIASYSLSKSALNMLTSKQAVARPDLISFVIDPGWVRTDMGGQAALLSPKDSAAGLLEVVTSATKESSGKFFRYDGETNPW